MKRFWGRPNFWISGGLFLLTLAFVLGFTVWFVGKEHYFYSWDLAFYQAYAQDTVHEITAKSRTAALKLVARSLGDDYNLLFTVPLVPFGLGLGNSRQVYEIGLAVVYLLPFGLVCGLVGTRLIANARFFPVFWSAVALTVFTPLVWSPLLYGYPDIGAATLLGLAIWAYLYDRQLGQWWQIPLIGLALVGAILFRRHFAYGVTAFYFALGLDVLAEARTKSKKVVNYLINQLWRIGLTGLIIGVVLLTVGARFLAKISSYDPNTLYASYLHDWWTVLDWFGGGSFGWLAFVLAIAGFGLGWRYQMLKPGANFVLLFGLVSLAQWVLLVRQISIQYTLHITLVLIMGLLTLGWVLWQRRKKLAAKVGLFLVLLYIIANFTFGITPLTLPDNFPGRVLFSASHPPLVREDYAEVGRLINYLREKAPKSEPLYVVASTLLMNDDLIRYGEAALYGQQAAKLKVLYTPHVDSRDFYPLQVLTQAEYALVVEPFQHHLEVTEQKLVKVSYDMFTQSSGIGADFEKLPETFKLEKGATAYVYHRIRPTSLQIALNAYRNMQSLLPLTPGRQLPWIAISPLPANASLGFEGKTGRYYITLLDQQERAFGELLYYRPLAENLKIQGKVSYYSKSCSGANLVFARVNSQGQPQNQTEFRAGLNENTNFSLNLSGQSGEYLTVRVLKQAEDTNCQILLEIEASSS